MTTTASYSAHAFHESFKKGRASGQLTLSDCHIHVENDQGQVRFPISNAEFSLGGASDRLLFIKHPTKPDWNLYTSDLSILNNPLLQNDPAVQQQVKAVKNKKRLAWGIFAAVAMVIIAIPLLIVMQMDGISATVAEHVPPEWEEELGETAFAQYQRGQQFMEDAQAKELLAPLTAPLLEALNDERFEYRFYISGDDVVNAFALPGGYIVINSGLILKADSAEELLGVVAHEIAHVSEQHSIRSIIGTAGVYITISAVLGDMSGIFAILADAAPFLIRQSYSRGFESEADEIGLALLHDAQINPQGLVTFFEKLMEIEAEQKEDMGEEYNNETVQSTLAFLSTHPATEDRIEHLEKRIAQLPHQRHRDFDQEFLRLKERVKQFVAHEEEEQQ